MKKKILFCASTASHIINFHLPYLKAFKSLGYEVHVATNESVTIPFADKVFRLPFIKNMISPKNILAIFKAVKLLKSENYEKISSNTTLAGLIIRFAALFLKNRPRIYHIVHGYHFNLNSGIRKFLYLIPEKIAARVSDVVMVMNHEDHEIANKYKLYRSKLYYINGMGVDESRFKLVSAEKKRELREKMGIPLNEFVFVYAAEFSHRKNQALLIRAFTDCSFENGTLLLAGDGKELNECKKLATKLGKISKIRFLGYVKDIPELYAACDAAVSVSRSEGLPFNIIEAMGCGLPVIASNIKGHRELVEDFRTGLLFESLNESSLKHCMNVLYAMSTEQLRSYGNAGIQRAKKFSIKYILPEVLKHYMS